MTEKETLIPVSVEELAALEVLATKTLYLLKGPKSGWKKTMHESTGRQKCQDKEER